MSGTRVQAQVRPGAKTAAALAALRGQQAERRDVRVQQAAAVRQAATRTASAAPREGVRSRSATSKRSSHGPRVPAAGTRHVQRVQEMVPAAVQEAALGDVKAQEEREIAAARHQLVFAEMLANLPPGMAAAETTRSAGGSLAATIQIENAGTIAVEIDERGVSHANAENCGLHELATDRGTVVGCDAEDELVSRIHAAWAAAGLQVEPGEASAVPIQAAARETGR